MEAKQRVTVSKVYTVKKYQFIRLVGYNNVCELLCVDTNETFYTHTSCWNVVDIKKYKDFFWEKKAIPIRITIHLKKEKPNEKDVREEGAKLEAIHPNGFIMSLIIYDIHQEISLDRSYVYRGDKDLKESLTINYRQLAVLYAGGYISTRFLPAWYKRI